MTNATQDLPGDTKPASHLGGGREAFAAYMRRRVLKENTPELQRLSVELFRALGRGAPATREQLGIACGLPTERIDRLLLEFPPTNFRFDEQGQVIAFGGLSLVPTHHRFQTEDAGLYTWCVLTRFSFRRFSASRRRWSPTAPDPG